MMLPRCYPLLIGIDLFVWLVYMFLFKYYTMHPNSKPKVL